MIAELLAAVIATLETVPALTGNIGTSVGSAAPDPTSIDIPLPAAWPVYVGNAVLPMQGGEPVRNGMQPRAVVVKSLISVMIYLDNSKGQSNLINTQLPVLETVTTALRGLNIPAGSTNGFRLIYEGERVHSITPSRLSYEQRYSIMVHL